MSRLDLKRAEENGGYFNIPNLLVTYCEQLNLNDAEELMLMKMFRFSSDWAINFSKVCCNWSKAKRTRTLCSLREKKLINTKKEYRRTKDGVIVIGLVVNLTLLINLLYSSTDQVVTSEPLLTEEQVVISEPLVTDQVVISEPYYKNRDIKNRLRENKSVENPNTELEEVQSLVRNQLSFLKNEIFTRQDLKDYREDISFIDWLDNYSPSSYDIQTFTSAGLSTDLLHCLKDYYIDQLLRQKLTDKDGSTRQLNLGFLGNYPSRKDSFKKFSYDQLLFNEEEERVAVIEEETEKEKIEDRRKLNDIIEAKNIAGIPLTGRELVEKYCNTALSA